MAKTFMDVQLECVLYPYSQECLELTRECSEIDLMDTFIRRAEFMQEARELEMEMGSLVTESYFGESADDSELDAVQDRQRRQKDLEGYLQTLPGSGQVHRPLRPAD